MNKLNLLASVGALAILMPLQHAVAQTSDKEAAANTSAGGLEEVTVTARRRAESAQTASVSVTALSSAALEERDVRQLGDLTALVPGIRFVHQGGGGNMNVTLRGLARVPIGTAPNAVINYFADIPLNFSGSNLPTYDLASIQVLKGPQGTLFGRNAIAGAVVITPEAPSYKFGGYVRGSFGNTSYRDGEFALNVPIVNDRAALRLAGKVSRRDGYTKTFGIGSDQDNVHQDSMRVSLLLEPFEGLRNTTIGDYFKATEVGTANIFSVLLPKGLVYLPPLARFWNCHAANPIFNPVPCTGFQPGRDINDAFAQQQRLGPRTTFSDIPQRLFREAHGVVNRTELQLGSLTLRNIFGFRRTHVETDLNTDGLAFSPPIINASNRMREEQYSDEIHLFGAALDKKLDYLVGLFYIHESPFGPEGFNFPVASPAAPWVISYTTKINQAVFGQAGYQIVEGLKFNAGVRFNKDRQRACAITPRVLIPTTQIGSSQPSVGPDDCPATPGSSIIGVNGQATTYNVGIDWRVSPNLFTYIVHRKGYREGGLNYPAFKTPASSILARYQSYEPETLKDIEIGLKSDWSVGGVRGRANIALYSGNYANVVTPFNTSSIIPATDAGAPQSSSFGANTGKRRISGVETELVVEPFNGFTITNTAAYTNQTVIDSFVPSIPGLAPPFIGTASPKWATTTAVRWALPLPQDQQVVLDADYYWQGSYFVTNDQLPAYSLTNLRVAWNHVAGTGLEVGLVMRNVFDQANPIASSAGSANLGFYTRSYGEPRMYAAEIGYSF